jgi:hypothetical protein
LGKSPYLSVAATWVVTAGILVAIHMLYKSLQSYVVVLGACLIAQAVVQLITKVEKNKSIIDEESSSLKK